MWKQQACASTVSEYQLEMRRVLLSLPTRNLTMHEEFMAQDGLFALDVALIVR